MKKVMLTMVGAAFTLVLSAQSPVAEYYSDKGKEKVKKSIVPEKEAETGKSFSDGHGVGPYLTKASQIPDTLALITFYVYDKGTEVSSPAFITTYSLSDKGGNYFANKIHQQTIDKLKETFKGMGVVLLTPDQFLDTKEKKDFYYNTFKPQISKMGNFLSGLETRSNNVSVCADGYRGFDVAAAQDFRRAESLGGELAKKLDVDGTLSIGLELAHEGKEVNMNGVKWAINAGNPNPKEDKKYVAENMGNGYYLGQTYFKGYFYFPKGMKIAKETKKQLSEENYEGIDLILGAFAEKSMDSMKAAIEKTSK